MSASGCQGPPRSCPLSVLAAGVSFLAAIGAEPARPLSPEGELATFHFADSTLVAELVAAEPEVSSPVALTWDADGRLFVAEMRDYPNAREGGAIRRLEDLDGDGRYEEATLFADALPFPNSVLPWNGGILVTAAPDLWFLRDTNGDGRADERRVLFTGFGTGNQQLRANGLFWGLDGWVYGANGRSDGDLRRVYDPAQITPVFGAAAAGVSIAPNTNAVSLRGRDFRFRPDTGEFETLAGRSQFGHSRDDVGRRFLSWNTVPLRQEVFPDRHLAGSAHLASTDVLQDCLPPGDSGQVFPLTPPPLVFNAESGSHFNALSGMHIYRGDALGTAYSGNAFVGESLRNLVHRRVLVPDGPVIRADRGEEGREFLAATDPWFHPVNFATGPDGALYIADFYRQFVEHPDWVAKEMRERVAWAVGSERGRIWRVKRKNPAAPVGQIRLSGLSTQELVNELDSANGWRRDTAQRLLIERRDRSASGGLEQFIRTSPRPVTRVQALFTGVALGMPDTRVIRETLQDLDPRVRAAAAKIAGELLAARVRPADPSENPGSLQSALAGALAPLAKDSDAMVRLETAIALGAVMDPAIREPALESIARSTTNRWLLLAVAGSTHTTNPPWLAALQPVATASRPAPAPRDPDLNRIQVVERFQPALRLTGDRSKGAALCAKLCLACHYLQGQGQRVGPDLSGTSSRPAETLLVDLLDPNRQVSPDYVAYDVFTIDGAVVTGLIASETPTRLTLRHSGSPDSSIARSQIRELRATGRSLMPEGLEENLTPTDVADLLAFLRKPDGELLPK